MGSLLADIIPPPTPPTSPPPQPGVSGISHSASAPPAISNVPFIAQPIAEPSGHSLSAQPAFNSGSRTKHQSSSPSRPNSLHVTPSSSNPSSPHRAVILPPSTLAPHHIGISSQSTAGSNPGTSRRVSSYNHVQVDVEHAGRQPK